MAELVTPKNTLKEKVGSGGFDKENLARAEKAIENNEIDFRPIAQPYLEDIQRVTLEYKTRPHSGALSKLLDPLMQLRAQGTFFKYPSISKLADIIVDLLDSEGAINDLIIDIIDAFAKSGILLLKSEVKNLDHPVYVAISQELDAACKRYVRKKGGDGL